MLFFDLLSITLQIAKFVLIGFIVYTSSKKAVKDAFKEINDKNL